jgi:surface protein with Ig-like domain/VCBS repeat protein/putative Ig domain-containing protein/uncharacterized protein DUF11
MAPSASADVVFTSSPSTSVDQGAAYRYDLQAVEQSSGKGRGNDDDDDKKRDIKYSAPLLPRWLRFDGDDRISGTPSAADVGSHAVRVTASVGGDSAVQNFQILVKAVSPTPPAPMPPAPTPTPPAPGPAGADLVASIEVAPSTVAVGASAVWTFGVANRSDVNVANAALRAALVSVAPLTLDKPSHAGCSVLPAGNTTTIDCNVGSLSPNASASVRVTSTSAGVGDVGGTVTVSISDASPVDRATDNNVARATLTISERVSGGPVQMLPAADGRASAAGDLDGDGKTDLAVVSGGSVVLYKGVADPANPNKRLLATTPVTLWQATTANALAAADLDGDRDLDLVTANGAGASDMILLNSGASGFSVSPIDGSTDLSRAVAIGDLDGDGQPEIVFANAQSGALARNSGAGKFSAPAQIGSHDARDVAIAQLLGDASPEIVFANANADATIYRRNAAGFELAGSIATGPATSVAAADFDRDGDLDLVFGRTAQTSVYRNDSSGTAAFALMKDLSAGPSVDVLTGYFDGDANLDIVTINGAGGQLHLNDGAPSPTFTPHPERFVLTGARSAALGKISVDARDDVIVASSGGMGIFFNDGAGNFGAGDTAPPTLTLNGSPTFDLTVGLAYQDPGATAVDAIDGDLTSKIVVSSPVDPVVVGTYTVTYRVVDTSGNAATPVTRAVRVQAKTGTGGGGGGSVNVELLLLALLACFRVLATSRSRTAAR